MSQSHFWHGKIQPSTSNTFQVLISVKLSIQRESFLNLSRHQAIIDEQWFEPASFALWSYKVPSSIELLIGDLSNKSKGLK